MKVGNGRLNAAAILSADIKASFLQLFAIKEHCHVFGACVTYVCFAAVEKLHALIFVKQIAARCIGVYIEILYTVFAAVLFKLVIKAVAYAESAAALIEYKERELSIALFLAEIVHFSHDAVVTLVYVVKSAEGAAQRQAGCVIIIKRKIFQRCVISTVVRFYYNTGSFAIYLGDKVERMLYEARIKISKPEMAQYDRVIVHLVETPRRVDEIGKNGVVSPAYRAKSYTSGVSRTCSAAGRIVGRADAML